MLVRRLFRGDPLALQRILGSKVEGGGTERCIQRPVGYKAEPLGVAGFMSSSPSNLSFSIYQWAWEPCPLLAGCQLAWVGAGLGA